MKSKPIIPVHNIRSKPNLSLDKAYLEALIDNLQLHTRYVMENIALPSSDGFIFVHINDIVYIQAQSNYSRVFMNSGVKHLLSKTLKDIVELIPFPQFFRPHQSFYVNMNYARQYIRGKNAYLIIKEDTEIPVSKINRSAILDYLVSVHKVIKIEKYSF